MPGGRYSKSDYAPLTDRMIQVLKLKKHGMSHEAIADRWGCTIANVSMTFKEARRRLQCKLKYNQQPIQHSQHSTTQS